MKMIKMTLVAAALVLGVGGAFASQLDATAWFYVDGSGNPTGNALPGSPSCDPGPNACAKLYNINGSGQPVSYAGSTVNGTHQ